MSSSVEKRRRFIERFEEIPVIRAIRERFNFQATMVVVTHGNVDYVAARDYVRSEQMCGRVRPQPNMRDDIVHWFFELEEDAVLFCLKFTNTLPKRITE